MGSRAGECTSSESIIFNSFTPSEQVHVVNSSSGDPVLVSVHINNVPVEMEIDSGSGVALISNDLFTRLFPQLTLSATSTSVVGVGGPINIVGQVQVSVSYNNNLFSLMLVVGSNTSLVHPLLGRPWLDALFPGWRTVLFQPLSCQSVTVTPPTLEHLRKLFPRPFDTASKSCIEGFTAKLVLKEGARPIKHGAYSIAFGNIEPVNKILDDWVKSGKAIRVRQAEWASPGVPIPKKDGSLRYCVDFKTTLNPQLRTDHYPLPRPDFVFASLSKGSVFTSIDLKDAYTQLQLDPDSQQYCIVNTHRGYYQLTRLIYGISSSAAIFQNVMDDILAEIPGVICYIDNILITGSDMAECVHRTTLVLSRLDKHNVRLRLDKCTWFTSKLEFLGFVVSKGCKEQSPALTSAVLNFPTPTNAKQVHSFLGLLGFYDQFIPMYSTLTRPLRDLTKVDVPFTWSMQCQKAFLECKSALVSNDILVLYDPSLPIVVYCDASPVGVGSVLCHSVSVNGKLVDKPVMYASCTLTPTQQNYAQIDREALAVIFSINKFHRFLWGRPFTLITDNFAVQRILGDTKGLPLRTGHRLQHWAAILQAYQYKLVHKKSEFLRAADALSRLPVSTTIEYSFHVKVLTELPITSDVVAAETAKDPVLSKVIHQTKLGWPHKVTKDLDLVQFSKYKDSLTIEKSCLMWAARVVIPSSLRAKVLKLLHEGHPGIVRTKALARSLVYWPSINSDIEVMCNNCLLCTKVNFSTEQIFLSWPEAKSPFERVHVDFFEFRKVSFFILVDAYSKWLNVNVMTSLNATAVTDALLAVFAVYGLPARIVSDNGPPFDSNEYAKFCTMYNITIIHSPIYHPASNGLVERNVSIVKQALRKLLPEDVPAKDFKNVLCKFLFTYRNTPNTVTLKSPNEMLLSFKPRTLLSILLPLQTNLSTSHHFRNGERVFLKLHERSPIVAAVVVHPIGSDMYLVSVEGVLKSVHHNQLSRSRTL